MKLRNKKTGEIINNNGISFAEGNYKTYSSLAELSEEWEDYEEPNKYYYVGDRGTVYCEKIEEYDHIWHEARRAIGNYFETKEEAEKAVEKLKAWKRLKDKGFRFEGWDNTDHSTIHNFSLFVAIEDLESINKDLDLLFGGEE